MSQVAHFSNLLGDTHRGLVQMSLMEFLFSDTLTQVSSRVQCLWGWTNLCLTTLCLIPFTQSSNLKTDECLTFNESMLINITLRSVSLNMEIYIKQLSCLFWWKGRFGSICFKPFISILVVLFDLINWLARPIVCLAQVWK